MPKKLKKITKNKQERLPKTTKNSFKSILILIIAIIILTWIPFSGSKIIITVLAVVLLLMLAPNRENPKNKN